MECVSFPRFFILINGSPTRYFEVTRGLQQSDLMSPQIFCLVVEVLTSMIEKELVARQIKLIPECKAIQLSHLAFVDNLMIFTRADGESLTSINNVLNYFSMISRIEVNQNKSIQIFASVPNHV